MAKLLEEQKNMLDKLMQERICRAATGVIIECGMKNTTMSKVADEAGVAKGTIYNYFKDKKELLASIFDSVLNPVIENVVEIAESSSGTLTKLREIAGIMLKAFSKHKKLFMTISENRISHKEPFEKREKLISIVEKIMEKSINNNEFKAFSSRIATEIFLGMIMSINITKMTTGKERSVEEDLDTIMTIFTHGIAKNETLEKVTANENKI